MGAGGIGAVSVTAAETAAAATTISVEGAGADIWNDYDEFHYYYTEVDGDFDVTVRVDSLENTDEYAKAGLMIRQSMADNEEHAMIRKMPGHDTSFQWRSDDGEQAVSTTSDGGSGESEVDGGTMQATWQRLVRSGDTIEAYGSTDGENWTLIADISPSTIDFAGSAYVGLAVCSHNTGTLSTAEFSNLSGLSPGSNTDIGNVDVAGSVSESTDEDTDVVVSTGSASNVSDTAATLSGAVDDLGGAESVDVSFEYRETGASSWTATSAQTVTAAGSVNQDVSGLTESTDYEFRAVATASDGDTDTGSTNAFATASDPPVVSTGTSSEVDGSSATLSGSLDDLGGASSVDVSFEYRPSGSSSWSKTAAETLSSTGSFSRSVTGLSSGETYEYRAVAAASDGDANTGSTSTFSTTSDGSTTGVTVEGAGADIWNEADEGHYYFADASGDFDVAVHVDSVENTDSYAKGGLMFRETLDADARNAMARTLPDGTTSFQWRETVGGTTESTTSDGSDVSQVDGGQTSASWQRLERVGDTVRAYTSTDGASWTLIAELTGVDFATDGLLGLAVTSHNSGTLCTAEFSDLSGASLAHNADLGAVDASGSVSAETAPRATTGSAADVTSSSTTLSGSLDTLGGASSADVAFEYRESGASSWSQTAAQTLSSTGSFSSEVTGLDSDTGYEYRAIATASDGDTDAGFVETFTTRPPDTAPAVTTGEASNVSSSAAELSGSLDDLGGAQEADVAFEYREVGTEQWSATSGQTLSETGTFSETEYGLSATTDYEFRAVLTASDGDTDAGEVATFTTTDGATGDGGAYFHYEDGYADTDWFDDSVEVIKVGANLSEIQNAFTTDSKRLIVFEESGVVDLQGADLSITYGNCWVAGQTAPSPGITFINGMVQVEQSNTVVQHIRVLRGDESGGEGTDPLNNRDGSQNVIFDHCTSYWGRDENLSVGYDSDRTTVSNCLVAEGLEDPEENSNGTLVGDGATNVAVLGTVYAKNNDRNPRLKTNTDTVVVNGLNYYFDKAIWIDGGAQASVVGNAYIGRFDWSDAVVFGDGSVYFDDNYVADPGLDGRDFQNVGTELSSAPNWPSGLEPMSSADVENHNLTYAGARPADRIDHETRVITDIRERRMNTDVDSPDDSDIPNSHTAVGGYPDHGGTTHTLDVPDTGLEEWLEQQAVAVETGDSSGGGGGGSGDTDPSVTTDSATSIDSSSATLNGTLEGLGGADSVDVSFEWRNTTDDAWTATATETMSQTGSFSAEVSGLSSGTSYEYRAVASASDGDATTGATSTFSTSTDTNYSGGAYFEPSDGFATPSWFDDSVEVHTVTEATRSALANAVQGSSPRLVVFETSGTIDLGGSPLTVTNDQCWIAGQTAPSPGITLTQGLFQVDANDVVVQHLRSRVGPGSDGSIQGNDSFNNQDQTTNVIFDHCTASWGVDECMSVGYNTDRTTFTNCLVYEGLYDPYGDGSDHNYCTLVGDGSDRVALLGTVWAKARSRIPRLKSDTRSVVANNFCYFFDEASNVDSGAETTWVGNKYTGLTATGESIVEGSGTVYSEDNVTADPPTDSDVSFVEQSTTSSRPLWPSGLSAMSSSEVEGHNLNYAGARPADRTSNDSRIIQEIRDRAGNDRLDSPYDYWVADHEEVGGYPSLPENTHSLTPPDSGLRDWVAQWALAVEESDASPP